MSKTLETRIMQKFDSKENWDNSTFTSLKGEIYIYAPDSNYPFPRIKFGDGVNKVKNLPFASNVEFKD